MTPHDANGRDGLIRSAQPDILPGKAGVTRVPDPSGIALDRLRISGP